MSSVRSLLTRRLLWQWKHRGVSHHALDPIPTSLVGIGKRLAMLHVVDHPGGSRTHTSVFSFSVAVSILAS